MTKFLLFMRWLDKAVYVISRICAVMAGILIALVAIMIASYIINRATFGFQWLFVEEWTSLALVAISYLGLGYTLRHGRHIYVDVILRNFSKRKQLFCGIISGLLCIIVLICMLERSWDLLSYNWVRDVRASGPLRTPLWIPTLAMNLGLLVCLLDFIFFSLDRVLRFLLGEEQGLNFYSAE